MGLVEKAARTLAQVHDGADWDGLAPDDRERFRDSVCAVVQALREPDTIMAEAGAEIIRNVGPAESLAAHLSDAETTWRFMIDALLSQRR